MCAAVVLDEEGELFDETRFMNTPESIEKFVQRLSAYRDEVKAMVGVHGEPMDPGPQ